MLAPDILPLASLLPLSRATSPFDFTAASANLTAEWRNRFRAGPRQLPKPSHAQFNQRTFKTKSIKKFPAA